MDKNITDNISAASVDAFLARWQGQEGGQERANYALFLTELCQLLDLPSPDPAGATAENNNYVFERVVKFQGVDGPAGLGRIDFYKRGCFVLEAKQSRMAGGKKEVSDLGQQKSLFGDGELQKSRGRRTADRRWDVLMMNARRQAEDYARALPVDHGWPPFILVCDVGHCIEVFADFSGQGKNYAQFPDRKSFRVYLEDLRDPAIRARLQAIWMSPQDLDPARTAAVVTREIAHRLAQVAKSLEKRGYPAEKVALFLMRCLFTMFAEDVKLLPENSFQDLLADCVEEPKIFPGMLQGLWTSMNTGGLCPAIRKHVKRFNGSLFADATALPLEREEIGELLQAAQKDWRQVEPAIFGTLLEQALNSVERKKLGAHYTPRAYVERLVVATIIEPLRQKWAEVLAGAELLKAADDMKGAIAAIKGFHAELCETKVLDPACGTGNFLYVAMELMKRLEGEVLEALNDLGEQDTLTWLESHTVDPHQFLGLELNPRAAAIAELVLWIGYLQWHFRTQTESPTEPILRRFQNINFGKPGGYDAVLARDGWPQFKNPRLPDWPQAHYIVGNPPFIGGKDIRARLEDGYAEALWSVHKHINNSADFVMYWWDRAADILTRKGSILRRFGFVTTNSITQEFSRRVIQKRMDGKIPLSLVMAIPDHPWTKATADAAAVRIAMTVAEAGSHNGLLREVVTESALDSDQPALEFVERRGHINADLTVGVDVTKTKPLKANEYICSPGVKLHGAGFIVTPQQAEYLGLGKRPGLERYIRPYRNGRDLTGRSRNVMVIDLFGLDAEEVRHRFPEVYQHLLQTVKVSREAQLKKSKTKDTEEYAKSWWIFGKPRQELRAALQGIAPAKPLQRYIATVETAKHRVFQFLDTTILPDNMLVCMGLNDAYYLGVLSSFIHQIWTYANCALLGVAKFEQGHRYTKSKIFDPFPFPDPPESLKQQIRAVAEELDALRKSRLAEHPQLTLTGLYNVRDKIRSGEPLSPDDEWTRDHGHVLILNELHDRLDALVAQAYGWPADLTEDAILERLVALNAERAAEEASGKVRWLRPDYQAARAGLVVAKEEQYEADLVQVEAVQKPAFPSKAVEQTAAVMAALAGVRGPVQPAALAAQFRQGKRAEPRIVATLSALGRMGYLTKTEQGFTLRA